MSEHWVNISEGKGCKQDCMCVHTLLVAVLVLMEGLRVQNSGQNQRRIVPDLEDTKSPTVTNSVCLTSRVEYIKWVSQAVVEKTPAGHFIG